MQAAYEVIASYDYTYAKKAFVETPSVITALEKKHAS
jgi:protein-tyrosine phosphatase